MVALNAIPLLIFLCVAFVRIPVFSIPVMMRGGGVVGGAVPAPAPPLPAAFPDRRVRPRPLPLLPLPRLRAPPRVQLPVRARMASISSMTFLSPPAPIPTSTSASIPCLAITAPPPSPILTTVPILSHRRTRLRGRRVHSSKCGRVATGCVPFLVPRRLQGLALLLQLVLDRLGPLVQADDSVAALLDVILLNAKDRVP